MDSQPLGRPDANRASGLVSKRWIAHGRHEVGGTGPHRLVGSPRGSLRVVSSPSSADRLITLDGSSGEGGGQILRSALTLSLLTGRPFRIVKIRANREQPGLRPQHLNAVMAAAQVGQAEVSGASVGSRDLTFRPKELVLDDLTIDIGTAGSTALVLHTLYLPLALRAGKPVRLTLVGGTFNFRAPSFPFLDRTWKAHLSEMGQTMALGMPEAGFYPRGGGKLDAWIEPGTPRALVATERGALKRITLEGGVSRLTSSIAERMIDRARERLADMDLDIEPESRVVTYRGISPGAALTLCAEYEHGAPVTFVGLGERGKSAETVADEAVDEWWAHHVVPGAVVDPHSADQLLLPLALAEGRSVYTVSDVTDHLRTNIETIQAFLNRPISLDQPTEDGPIRVIIG